MKQFFILLVCLMALSACTAQVATLDPGVMQTALAQTLQAQQVITLEATQTNTEVSTFISTPEDTATPTITQTLPPTNTLTPINTPMPTDTPTPTIELWKQTSIAQRATQNYLDNFEVVDIRDFKTYPDKYDKKLIKISGTIFNINGNTQFQIYLTGTRDAAYIISVEEFDNLYEGDYVTIYGVGTGENCGKNALGGEVCQPLVVTSIIHK